MDVNEPRQTNTPPRSRTRGRSAGSVGSYFRTVRVLQGLSLGDVAAMSLDHAQSISKSMLSGIERGRHLPGLETLVTLCSILHVDPSEVHDLVHAAADVSVNFAESTPEEVRERAKQRFWAGDYRKALALYNAMLQHLAASPPGEVADRDREHARVQILRATALRRMGAFSAARAAALRATTLAEGNREVQAEGYVVLAGILSQTGDLPVARDLARRAVNLVDGLDRATQGLAWHQVGAVDFRRGDHAAAYDAFRKARELVRGTRNENHLAHIEGNIGSCLLEMGRRSRAHGQFVRAIELAKKYGSKLQEAGWTIQLGILLLDESRDAEAESCARTALGLARRHTETLTIFRAQLLLHRARSRSGSAPANSGRLVRLRGLFQRVRHRLAPKEITQCMETGLGSVEPREGGSR